MPHMSERKLDWVPQFDPRSRNYRLEISVPVERRANSFLASHHRLDQGTEGACVGFSITNELLSYPHPVRIGQGSIHEEELWAQQLYQAAKREDYWPGEDYEGTSVLAGMQIIHRLGLIQEYRWAFSVSEIIDALCASWVHGGGPVVIGIPWYESMYWTGRTGLVYIDGPMVGGHSLVLMGYHPNMRFLINGKWEYHEVVRWRNSWGLEYGRKGDGFVKVSDLAYLLAEGEACIPIGKKSLKIPANL